MTRYLLNLIDPAVAVSTMTPKVPLWRRFFLGEGR